MKKVFSQCLEHTILKLRIRKTYLVIDYLKYIFAIKKLNFKLYTHNYCVCIKIYIDKIKSKVSRINKITITRLFIEARGNII